MRRNLGTLIAAVAAVYVAAMVCDVLWEAFARPRVIHVQPHWPDKPLRRP